MWESKTPALSIDALTAAKYKSLQASPSFLLQSHCISATRQKNHCKSVHVSGKRSGSENTAWKRRARWDTSFGLFSSFIFTIKSPSQVSKIPSESDNVVREARERERAHDVVEKQASWHYYNQNPRPIPDPFKFSSSPIIDIRECSSTNH
jgi:hypothetical protein